MNKHIVD